MERNNTYVDEFVTDCETIAYLCLLPRCSSFKRCSLHSWPFAFYIKKNAMFLETLPL